MKKILFLFSFFLALHSIIAQKDEISFGVKGGLNISNEIIENSIIDDNSKSKVGFHIGGLVEISLSNHFSLQPEMLFSSQGSIETIEAITYSRSLNYINTPILINYIVVDNLKIQAGPQIGFLLSGKEKVDVNFNKLLITEESDPESIATLENTFNTTDSLKKIDAGLNLGLTYELNSKILFSTRYYLGLTDTSESDFSTNKNSVFQVSAGYIF